MALQVRRVVTGHDADGKAVVLIDDIARTVQRRPGTEGSLIWTTESFPVSNAGEADRADREDSSTWLPNGTVFRVVSFEPGNAPRVHRTDSIDYGVVISGEIDMELDDTVVQLRAGDVLVQRGTIHNWVNRGSEPCVIAFALIDASPVQVGDSVLNAVG